MRAQVRSLASLSGLRIRHCRDLCVGHRCGSDLSCFACGVGQQLQLSIGPVAWELPWATVVALKRPKKKKKKSFAEVLLRSDILAVTLVTRESWKCILNVFVY